MKLIKNNIKQIFRILYNYIIKHVTDYFCQLHGSCQIQAPFVYLVKYNFPAVLMYNGKWFEPRSLIRLCGLIVRVRVVLKRTVVGDIDRRFDRKSSSESCNVQLTMFWTPTNKTDYYELIGFKETAS